MKYFHSSNPNEPLERLIIHRAKAGQARLTIRDREGTASDFYFYSLDAHEIADSIRASVAPMEFRSPVESTKGNLMPMKNKLADYTKNPKSLEAIQWDGTPDGAQVIANLFGVSATLTLAPAGGGALSRLRFGKDQLALSPGDYAVRFSGSPIPTCMIRSEFDRDWSLPTHSSSTTN